jgi:hypothetical protein
VNRVTFEIRGEKEKEKIMMQHGGPDPVLRRDAITLLGQVMALMVGWLPPHEVIELDSSLKSYAALKPIGHATLFDALQRQDVDRIHREGVRILNAICDVAAIARPSFKHNGFSMHQCIACEKLLKFLSKSGEEGRKRPPFTLEPAALEISEKERQFAPWQ